MSWAEGVLACPRLRLRDVQPVHCEVLVRLGFVRAGDDSDEWDMPGSKELLRNYVLDKPPRDGRPVASREIHHLYRDAQGEPLLWTCIAAVNSAACMCFGEQYAISTKGPCKFRAKYHIHKDSEPPPPPPTEEELASRAERKRQLRERARAGDKHSFFLLQISEMDASISETANIEVTSALLGAERVISEYLPLETRPNVDTLQALLASLETKRAEREAERATDKAMYEANHIH